MSERILVPLDGSKVGETALRYVEELVFGLAPGKKVEVTLFQVVPLLRREVSAGDGGFSIPYTEEEMEPIKQKAMDYLDKAGEALRSKGATVKCAVRVAEGGVGAAEEIIKAEGEVNADLVAMSTHGRHGISRWAFGSVTDKVLQGGNVPVLMVRVKKGTVES